LCIGAKTGCYKCSREEKLFHDSIE
jgi:hypothetical protein